MSTAPVASQPQSTVPQGQPAGRTAGFGHVLLSEWTKIRSVRSTVWSLIAFVVLTIGLTLLISFLINNSWSHLTPGQRVNYVTDPVGGILALGIFFGELAICVLGVLVITTEYSTGVIRASLLAVPRRLPMLAAKALVFTTLILVLAELVAFASFFIGSAILHSHVSVSLSDHDVLRDVYGTGLYLTVLGLFALGIGGIIRHTAGAIAVVLSFIIVLEPLSNLLPDSWGAHVHAYLPTVAGRLITGGEGTAGGPGGQLLSAWQGFGVFCLWTALLVGVAAYLLKSRDA